MGTAERALSALSGAPLDQVDIEKLGRQRPSVFSSTWSELMFCFSLLSTSMMAVSDDETYISTPLLIGIY
jgi:hypothetical protein